MPGLRRVADVVFPVEKVAVFIDGCFWHVCPEHATWPAANAEFWSTKLRGNVQRDRDTDERLRAEGWLVLRIWEHEDPDSARRRVETAVRRRRSTAVTRRRRS